jgi:translation initiation factor IF-2
LVTNNDKKTLGLKAGTLGLSKSQGEKLTVSPGSVKAVSSSSSSKGKVVVVTKASRTNRMAAFKSQDKSSSYLTGDELGKRVQLLKDAENIRKVETERKERDHKEELLRNERIAEENKALEETQKQILALEAAQLTQPTDVEIAPEVIEQVKRLKLDEIRQKEKVRDLNSYKVKVSAPEEETSGLDPALVDPLAVKSDTLSDKDAKGVIKKPKLDFDEESEAASHKKGEERRAARKLTVAQVMMMDSEDGGSGGLRRRSLASIRRAREKAKRKFVGDQKSQDKIVREVNVPDVITIQELANRMAEKTSDVIKSLMKLGMIVTVNQVIDADTAELVVAEFGHKLKRVTDAEIESALLQKVEDQAESLKARAPVVTVMGHVDHGKTSLLDALRATDVAAGEAGGITQHIGAYQVKLRGGQIITFLDTPGHEAFTAMRMRGAKVTDIVVLVVAADDGIMQQTIEAISHAKAAGVPIIVAINKMDKPDANPTRVKNELLSHGLVPEEMGGDTIVIEVSAKERKNLDKLEEAILLQADFLVLKANPDRTASGAVIESKVDKGRGPIATLLVQKGTLKVGDIVVAGTAWGKIRALNNDKGMVINEAFPSMPIEIFGLEEAPVAGDEFTVVQNEKVARDIVSLRSELEKKKRLVASKSITLEQLFKRAGSDGIKELPIIIKADVQGSVEAIANSLLKIGGEKIIVRILHSAVGGITESDVTLASASNAIIIGFNVRPNQQARDLARQNGVDIRYYSIIYHLVDDIKAAMTGMLSVEHKENIIGYVDVRQVFDLTKYGKVAGSYVTEGIIKRHAHARIIRDSVVIFDGKLKALKRFKDDVKEVNSGFECGLSFENYEDIKAGDRIEVYELIEQQKILS